MIVNIKNKLLKEQEKNNINNLLLSCFSNSRLETYHEVIYYQIENNIVGFLGLHNYDNYSVVNQLCVNYNYRNKGIASLLLKYLDDKLSTDIILFIDKNKESTEKLYNFYLNKGFIEADEDHYYNIDAKKIEYKMIKKKYNL
jgi:N-acetylglutamate synthase-like GNAT family acetyltransferase